MDISSVFWKIDNQARQAKNAAMRRAWVVAVLVIGAVLVRLLVPRYFLVPYIRSFSVHRTSEFFTDGEVLVGLVPLNVVVFWLLIAAAVVVAFIALRRRA